MSKGYVQIYTGDGKGKTTAAVGLAIRAAGRGLRVVFVQFLKGSMSGEVSVMEDIEQIRLIRAAGQDKVFWKLSDEEKALMRSEAEKVLLQICDLLADSAVDMLILDEALGALKNGIVSMDAVNDLLEKRFAHVEVVLTGRDAPKALVEQADLVTQMVPVKHYYNDGVKARKGIEF